MTELVEQARSLGIEVNPEWSEQYIKRQITIAQKDTGEDTSAPDRMFPVKLTKNYVPMDAYEIVGHDRPLVQHKDAAGRMITIQEAEFVRGEMSPPPFPGVGFGEVLDGDGNRIKAAKIWAGTTVKLPIDEARRLVQKRLAERADELP